MKKNYGASKNLEYLKGLLLAMISLVIATAIIITLAANSYPSVIVWLQPFVDSVDGLLSTKRMASKSKYIEIASIYYSFVVFVLPLSVLYTFIKIYFPPLWDLGQRYPFRERFVGLFSSMFLMSFAALTIYSMTGQDIRYIEIGSSLPQMVFIGWMLFAFCGFLFGFGLVALWKAISGR